jgi:adenylate kinase
MILLFLGPPGSGKGTQSKILEKRLGVPHLSTGDMFRKALSEETPVGVQAKAYMDRGEYVPDAVVIDLIKERVSQSDCSSGFILDGFPRTLPQAEALGRVLESLRLKLDHAINFQIPEDVLVTRLSDRRTCNKCGSIVKSAAANQQTPCKSGGYCEFVQRADDQPEVIRNRMNVYQEQTAPLLKFYQAHEGFISVNGDQDPELVTEAILKRL